MTDNGTDPYKVLKKPEQLRAEGSGYPFHCSYTIFGDGISIQELDEDNEPMGLLHAMLYWEDIIPYIPRSLLNKAGSKLPQHMTYKKTDASIDRFTKGKVVE